MRNRVRRICIAAIAAILTNGLVACSSASVTEARIVQVQKADVREIITLKGTVRYLEESVVLAHKDGKVSQICKNEGDRVAADEAIIRITSDNTLALLATYAAYSAKHPDTPGIGHAKVSLDAVRAKTDQTIRQIFIEEGDMVTRGTPIARLSSNRQEIICVAANVDAEKLQEGMWAWIRCEGDNVGIAYIERVENQVLTENGQSASVIKLLPDKHIACDEGQAVEVEVYISGSDNVNAIPLEAITSRGTVWWLSEEGRCVEIDARVVMDNGSWAWVELPDELTVAVGEFKEGQRIKVKNSETT
ncbi:MAG: hypothetical protein IKL25_10545 [Clostridia bacterium]|nr:hypothetical protein [Clostridia bacterium]